LYQKIYVSDNQISNYFLDSSHSQMSKPLNPMSLERKAIIAWLEGTIKIINLAENYGEAFVRARMIFARCHAPYIFSTRLGLFEDILDLIKNDKELEPQKLEGKSFLSEWDANFNKWMKELI